MIAECSHIGHIFRAKNPIKWNQKLGNRNYVRVAMVWMDEYKDYFFERVRYRLVRLFPQDGVDPVRYRQISLSQDISLAGYKTRVLSRQLFVTTNINFVTLKLLSRQNYVCRDETFVVTKIFCRDERNFCREKCSIAASILLSRQNTCMSRLKFCCDKKKKKKKKKRRKKKKEIPVAGPAIATDGVGRVRYRLVRFFSQGGGGGWWWWRWNIKSTNVLRALEYTHFSSYE